MKHLSRRKETASLTKAVLDYLQLNRFVAWRQNTGAATFQSVNKKGEHHSRTVFFGKKGISDILALHGNGTFFAIEIKTGDDRLSKEQMMFAFKILSNNGMFLEVRSLDSLIDQLDSWKHSPQMTRISVMNRLGDMLKHAKK